MSKEVFRHRFRPERKLTAKALVESYLDGDSYDHGGRLESVQAQANNVTEAFGRLVEILFDKKVLSKNDVYTIAVGYVPQKED